MNYSEQARKILYNWVNKDGIHEADFEDVQIVWFCKTLQNWKALLILTNHFDGRYYELTHNGDKNETYIDLYEKMKNVCIKD